MNTYTYMYRIIVYCLLCVVGYFMIRKDLVESLLTSYVSFSTSYLTLHYPVQSSPVQSFICICLYSTLSLSLSHDPFYHTVQYSTCIIILYCMLYAVCCM